MAIGDEPELRRDSDRAFDFEGRAGLGKIADGAIDGAAAEFDFPALQDPMSGRNSMLIHPTLSLPKCKNMLRFRVETSKLFLIFGAFRKMIKSSDIQMRTCSHAFTDALCSTGT